MNLASPLTSHTTLIRQPHLPHGTVKSAICNGKKMKYSPVTGGFQIEEGIVITQLHLDLVLEVGMRSGFEAQFDDFHGFLL
jgi:hypothetical protein